MGCMLIGTLTREQSRRPIDLEPTEHSGADDIAVKVATLMAAGIASDAAVGVRAMEIARHHQDSTILDRQMVIEVSQPWFPSNLAGTHRLLRLRDQFASDHTAN